MTVAQTNSKATWFFISLLLLLLIVLNTYISRTSVLELNALHQDISQTGEIVSILDETHLSLLKAESGQRGFLLTQDALYLRHYLDGVSNIRRLLDESEGLPSKLPNQQAQITLLKSLMEEKLEELALTVSQAQNDKFRLAIERVETDEGRILYEKIHGLFLHIKSETNAIGVLQTNQLQLLIKESERNLLIFSLPVCCW